MAVTIVLRMLLASLEERSVDAATKREVACKVLKVGDGWLILECRIQKILRFLLFLLIFLNLGGMQDVATVQHPDFEVLRRCVEVLAEACGVEGLHMDVIQ